MSPSPGKEIRREPRRTGGQTSRSAGRKVLAGSTSRSRPSARLKRVQRQFGKKIRTLRQNKRLTSGQLAKDCRVTALKISKIEDGRVNVALSTMIHLSKRLATTMDRLFEGIR